jgi:hypothetical protein
MPFAAKSLAKSACIWAEEYFCQLKFKWLEFLISNLIFYTGCHLWTAAALSTINLGSARNSRDSCRARSNNKINVLYYYYYYYYYYYTVFTLSIWILFDYTYDDPEYNVKWKCAFQTYLYIWVVTDGSLPGIPSNYLRNFFKFAFWMVTWRIVQSKSESAAL